ncbi:MAG: 6-hydroxymethylpterin diphosphokinase MptE-like protein [Thermoplasmata archaeon]
MEWADWEPYYIQILEDFGFDRRMDEEAARLLARLLPSPHADPEELRELVGNRVVTVLGNGPDLADELGLVKGVVIAADEATSAALQYGLRPSIIVTDLDGQVEDQIEANRSGSFVVIHAHGDNIEALRRWTPAFGRRTLGTTQAEPFGEIHNFGGFTDGDRAVYLADYFGARVIRTVGFDFERPNPKDRPTAVKLRKLAWAQRLLEALGRTRPLSDPSSASSG